MAGRKDFGRAEAFILASPTIVLGAATSFVVMRHIVIEPPFFVNPISGDIPGLSFQDITLEASDFGFGTIVVHAPVYDAVNDRVLFMVNADGTSARYLVAYKVGEGIVWMVQVNNDDTLPGRARFLYEQIWTYGGQAVTVRSAEDGSTLFRQTGFPHDNSVGRLMYDPDMSVRLLLTSAFALLFAGPVLADCDQAAQDLKEMVGQAETGAGGAGSALPTSPHQEQVLAGKQQGETGPTGQSAADQSGMAASPHQQQVLAGGQAGEQLSDLVAEASEMAKAGDEQGCMQKVNEAKGLLGIE